MHQQTDETSNLIMGEPYNNVYFKDYYEKQRNI